VRRFSLEAGSVKDLEVAVACLSCLHACDVLKVGMSNHQHAAAHVSGSCQHLPPPQKAVRVMCLGGSQLGSGRAAGEDGATARHRDGDTAAAGDAVSDSGDTAGAEDDFLDDADDAAAAAAEQVIFLFCLSTPSCLQYSVSSDLPASSDRLMSAVEILARCVSQ